MIFQQMLRAVSSGAILIALASISLAQAPAAHKTENVLVVMLDGMRWQEVFRGADPKLI